jgi:glycosyltransferase involved in cell wall biosynthesis
MTPQVSVIMPCYNAAAFLPASVGSVLAQTFPDWELVAVDDGSQDDTLAWLRSQSDARIRVLAQENRGVSAARNVGLGNARAPLVAFLDADDTWDRDFLKTMVGALEQHPDAVLAYCGWQNLGIPGPRGQPFTPPDYETPDKMERLFAGCRWPVHAALSRRQAILSAGAFDPSLKNAEDYALWLELAWRAPIVRAPRVLAFYHFHGGAQASGNRARAALHLLAAQKSFLRRHPGFSRHLGWRGRRRIMYGGLLRTGYDCYWKRDMPAARALFRGAMAAGYGRLSDWKYMLPALLPLGWHQRLLGIDAGGEADSARSSSSNVPGGNPDGQEK